MTPHQYRQCLLSLGLVATEREIALIEVRFMDNKGFNYLQFLEELQPPERQENKFRTRMTQIMEKREKVS